MNMKPQQQQRQPPRATPAQQPANNSPFTANEKRELCRMAAGGSSVSDLASQFGRPASLVAAQIAKGR